MGGWVGGWRYLDGAVTRAGGELLPIVIKLGIVQHVLVLGLNGQVAAGALHDSGLWGG